jgi:hypothetical protein
VRSISYCNRPTHGFDKLDDDYGHITGNLNAPTTASATIRQHVRLKQKQTPILTTYIPRAHRFHDEDGQSRMSAVVGGEEQADAYRCAYRGAAGVKFLNFPRVIRWLR